MKSCAECGLPMNVCNALAQYKEAVKYFNLNRKEEATRYAESAEDFYRAYRANQ